MWKVLVALAAVCVVSLNLLAADDKEPKKVELSGKLRTGVVAPGGETTGVIIETKNGKYELEFGKDKELREKADKLNGKPVMVAGTLAVKKGVEVKERKIVTVTKLEEAKE